MNREVPAFKKHEFFPRHHDYCVAIFMINEGDKLHRQLARMNIGQIHKTIDIVLADGGSSDGSMDHNMFQQYGVNTLLVKTGPGKLGAQMRMAFAWALDRGYKGVVVIDGNNKDSVENILDFVAKLEEGYDH